MNVNGYSKTELVVRDRIADCITAGNWLDAKRMSRSFIEANEARSAKRRHLLKATCRLWITVMNSTVGE